MPAPLLTPPRNGVELAIASMARQTRLGLDAARAAGAEWWVQDVAPSEPPKTFHFDCDLLRADDDDDDDDERETSDALDERTKTSPGTTTTGTRVAYPETASVLYLGDVGGATAVFGQVKKRRAPPSGDPAASSAANALSPRFPEEVSFAHPRRNRLLTFPGDRYHAVMRPCESPVNEEGQRVTLLVNWWRERPSGCADVPDRFASASRGDDVVDEAAAAAAAAGRDEPDPGRSARDTGVIPVLEDVYAFGDHVRAWRAQTLPAPLARTRDVFACATARYRAVAPDESDADAPEWPFDE